jgi:hypothetical protein
MKDDKDLNSDSSSKETKSSDSLFSDPVLQKQVSLFNNLSAKQKRWVFYFIAALFVYPSFIWLVLIALIFIYNSVKNKKSSETDAAKSVDSSIKYQSNNIDIVKKDVIKIGGINSADGYGKQESKNSALIWVILLIVLFLGWLFLNSR